MKDYTDLQKFMLAEINNFFDFTADYSVNVTFKPYGTKLSVYFSGTGYIGNTRSDDYQSNDFDEEIHIECPNSTDPDNEENQDIINEGLDYIKDTRDDLRSRIEDYENGEHYYEY